MTACDPATTIEIAGPADDGTLLDVFARAGEGSPTAHLWGHPAAEADVYLRPYLRSPGTVLLARVNGAAAGYLTGCPDPSGFPSESARLEAAVRRHQLWRRPRPMAFFARAATDTALARLRGRPVAGEFADPRWPAHLHLAVLPAHRGAGVAHALVSAWLDQVCRGGGAGCHVQPVAENARACAFFRSLGFTDHDAAVPVPGLRWRGRPVHQITMAKSLP